MHPLRNDTIISFMWLNRVGDAVRPWRGSFTEKVAHPHASVLGMAAPVARLSGPRPFMMGGVPPGPKVVRQPLVLLLRQRTSDSFAFLPFSCVCCVVLCAPGQTMAFKNLCLVAAVAALFVAVPVRSVHRTQKIRGFFVRKLFDLAFDVDVTWSYCVSKRHARDWRLPLRF